MWVCTEFLIIGAPRRSRAGQCKVEGWGWLETCPREDMALQTRYSRSRSARAHSAGNKKTASGADLHEMSRSKTCVAEFAAEHSLRTKSEVGVEQARREAKRDGRHQAWAPPKRHSLSSSSARFQRDPRQPLPPHPAKGVSSSESRREKVKLSAVQLPLLSNNYIYPIAQRSCPSAAAGQAEGDL